MVLGGSYPAVLLIGVLAGWLRKQGLRQTGKPIAVIAGLCGTAVCAAVLPTDASMSDLSGFRRLHIGAFTVAANGVRYICSGVFSYSTSLITQVHTT